MEHGILFVALACGIGLWMTWGIGANDLANIMSTAVGSKAITVRQALIIAIFFEVAGALFGGTGVTETIRSGIIDTNLLANTPQLLIYGMLSVLCASATWITLASFMGMPVSITNSIVGALVGVGAIMLGIHSVHWQIVGYIAISWISSPAIAGVLAFLLFISIKRLILGAENPFRSAQRYIFIYLALVSIVLSLMTVLKGLDHFHLIQTKTMKSVIVFFSAIFIFLFGWYAMWHVRLKIKINRHTQYLYIETMFSVLMAFTACAMIFAHGSNDVAIAVGPVTGVMDLAFSDHSLREGLILNSMLLLGSLGVILGLCMYGRKVIETVGSAITTLTPSRAFAATLAAASTVIVSTSTGIPVSATQTLVGAVFGVGLARGIDALNLNVIRNIFMSWVITIPATAGLATLFFYLLKVIFH